MALVIIQTSPGGTVYNAIGPFATNEEANIFWEMYPPVFPAVEREMIKCVTPGETAMQRVQEQVAKNQEIRRLEDQVLFLQNKIKILKLDQKSLRGLPVDL